MTRALGVGAGAAVAMAFLLSCGRPQTAAIDALGANAGCYVCHMTFVREELSKVHLAARVGCTRCHGTSAAHANDEDIGATKPDVAFARKQVNTFCRTCHGTHNVAPEKVVARWQQRCAARGACQKAMSAAACTDCHGSHKIAKASP